LTGTVRPLANIHHLPQHVERRRPRCRKPVHGTRNR